MRRLEREGVIERYAALLRPQAFDAVEGWAEIVLRERTYALTERVVAALSSEDMLVDIYELTGPFDMLIHFVAPSIEAWRAYERELERCLPEIASIRHGMVGMRRANRPLPVARLANI